MPSILKFESLKDVPEVKKCLEYLRGVQKPSHDIDKYLNNMQNLHEKTDDALEKYMVVYTSWMNFMETQLALADTIKEVAKAQSERFFSEAVMNGEGTINARKDGARSDDYYVQANQVLRQTEAYHRALLTTFNNCERGYALVSRIITKRLSIKERLH